MKFKVIGQEFLWDCHKSHDGFLTYTKIGSATEGISKVAEASDHKTIDSETTGLRWGKHTVFSFGIKTQGEIYAFNFQHYDTLPDPDFHIKDVTAVKTIFDKPALWVGHNLKFDYHMMRCFGFKLLGTLWCTMIQERILENDHFKYNLDSVAERNLKNLKKDDAVSEYIEKYGLYSLETVTGKAKPFKNKFFYLVPYHVITPYMVQDIEVTDQVFETQKRRTLEQVSLNSKHGPKLSGLMQMECELLQVCCDTEELGVLVDREFCEKGLAHEESVQKEIEKLYFTTYQKPFVDSVKELGPIFEAQGYDLEKTDAGNDSIGESFLQGVNNELSKMVLDHREAYKRKDTYFQAFLNLSKGDGALHPDMKQSGTRTGRFSYSDPNLQNIPAEDTGPQPVRHALVPRPGCFFFMPDYNQMEFRMMLDYAGQMDLIEKIKNGHDPHQATADLTGLSRKAAKTLNFGLLYGMGIQKLANALGISYDEAKSFKWQYFGALPKVKDLIYISTDVAKARKRVYTWAGRKLDFLNEDFAYKAINGVIQGGCADAVKIAMVKAHALLALHKTRILMQVHDELVFEVPYEEAHLVGDLKDIMESVYPHNHLPLTVGLSYSLKSFHESVEAKSPDEIVSSIRAHVHSKGEAFSGNTAQHMVYKNPGENHSGIA